VRLAFTLDDIPLWPRSYPPESYSVASIMQKISDALVKTAFGTSMVLAVLGHWSSIQSSQLSWTLGKRQVTIWEITRTITRSSWIWTRSGIVRPVSGFRSSFRRPGFAQAVINALSPRKKDEIVAGRTGDNDAR
jgi:hypothetical protein